jgi:FAD:protein FMN transferase
MNKNVKRRGGIAGSISDAIRVSRKSGSNATGYYLSLSRTAMACQFEAVLLPSDRKFVDAVQEAFDEVERQEQKLSVYRSDSVISQLNQAAAAAPFRVDADLYQLLKRASRIGAETGGAFDLTAGKLIRCWGFLNRQGRVPSAEELDSAQAGSGWEGLELDDEQLTAHFRKPAVELNLGSIGKGYALDRAARVLANAGLCNFLLHAGHSSILASGDSARGPGWEVGLRSPHGPGSGAGSIRLLDQAMSTSGAAEQYFVEGGRRYGHLLDPRTGWPAERNLMASAIAPDATLAEALSTAFYVMEEIEIRRYCAENKGVSAIIFGPGAPGSSPTILGAAQRPREEERN